MKDAGEDVGLSGEIVVGDVSLGACVIFTYARWTGSVPEHRVAVEGLMTAVSAVREETAKQGKVLRWQLSHSSHAITLDLEVESDDLHELAVLVGVIDKDGRTRNVGAKCVYRVSAPLAAVTTCREAIRSFAVTIADKDLQLIEPM